MILGRIFACISLLVLVVGQAAAQHATLVIENGRILVGDGRVVESGTIAISGDRILSVSEAPVLAPGARRIDAGGKTVLPGLIDTHVHLSMERLFEQPRDDATIRDYLENRLPGRLRSYVSSGITTVLSPGDYWPFIREIREELRSNDLAGPRLYTAGPLLTAAGGHPAVTFCESLDLGGPNPWCREHLTRELVSPDDARAAVAELALQGVDAIKIVYGGPSEPGVSELEIGLMEEVVEVAHRSDLPVYGHILDASDAADAIEAGLDGLVHLPAAFSHPDDLDRLVQIMRQERVTASTTLTIYDDFAQISAAQGDIATAEVMRGFLAGMERTLQALAAVDEGLIVVGTDAPHLPPGDAYHRELSLLIAAGLTPEQVLSAATRNAAVHIGLEHDLGTLEAGKLADIIIVEGDPLTDISALENVTTVIKGGEVLFQGEGGTTE